jgi:hypothetical protein
MQRLPPGAPSGSIREQVLCPSQLLLRVLFHQHSSWGIPPSAVNMPLDKPKLIMEVPMLLSLRLMALLVYNLRTPVAGNSLLPDSLRITKSLSNSNNNSNSNSNKLVPHITLHNRGSLST